MKSHRRTDVELVLESEPVQEEKEIELVCHVPEPEQPELELLLTEDFTLPGRS